MKLENGTITAIGKGETEGIIIVDVTELELGEIVYLCNCL